MCVLCVCVSHMVNEKLEQPSSISLTSHFFSGLPLRDLISLGLWTYTSNSSTVDTPIVDTPKSGQPPYNGQTVFPLPTTVCMLEPPKKGQPPNNGQNTRPQRVHCSEVPLYAYWVL